MTSFPSDVVQYGVSPNDPYGAWLTGEGAKFETSSPSLEARVAQLEAEVTDLRQAMYAKMQTTLILMNQMNDLRVELATKSDKRPSRAK